MADQNSVLNPGAPLPPFHLSCDNHINSTTFTPDIVLRQLSNLDSAKATGPDNIAARVMLRKLRSHCPIFLYFRFPNLVFHLSGTMLTLFRSSNRAIDLVQAIIG